jgi:hypothetical protein
MESDGVYFPEYVQVELQRRREELVCEYSGLRSLVGYMEEDTTIDQIENYNKKSGQLER